jgi:spermidine/putrescine-binding protein
MTSKVSKLMLASALAAALSLTGCGDGSSSSAKEDNARPTDPAAITGTVRLYALDDGFNPDYIKSFRDTYPNIKLETASFGNGDEAIAKVQAGFQADVINSCLDESSLDAVQKGVYAPLDTSRLEHWDKIWPSMKELPGVTVDGDVYVVPVDAGGAGMLYNADKITTPPTSWTDLFDEKNKGRASLQDNPVTAIDVGALATGITDPLNIDATQLDGVKKFLTDKRSQFRTLWSGSGDIAAQFKAGEVDIASGYTSIARDLQADGVNVQFAVPKEGQMLWTCGYGISPNTDPKNLDAAYALLNWYTSLPAQIYAATNWYYLTSNSDIVDAVTPEVRKGAALDSLYNLDEAIPASPPKDRQAWTKAWAEVKAS